MAEWSKALASGASPSRAWVRIPLLSFFFAYLIAHAIHELATFGLVSDAKNYTTYRVSTIEVDREDLSITRRYSSEGRAIGF